MPGSCSSGGSNGFTCRPRRRRRRPRGRDAPTVAFTVSTIGSTGVGTTSGSAAHGRGDRRRGAGRGWPGFCLAAGFGAGVVLRRRRRAFSPGEHAEAGAEATRVLGLDRPAEMAAAPRRRGRPGRSQARQPKRRRRPSRPSDAEEALERGDERAQAREPQLRRKGMLEPLRQRAAGTEDERLDRRSGQPQLFGDLRVRAAPPFPHDDRPPLQLGHVGERVREREELLAGRLAPGATASSACGSRAARARDSIHAIETGRGTCSGRS